MIPQREVEVSSDLPAEATYWMPTEEDIPDDEGIGFFRDNWIILGWTREEASDLLTEEKRICQLVDDLSASAEVFEVFAKAVENGDAEDIPADVKESDRGQAFANSLSEEYSPLEGLELGVSGLTHALCAIGCVPVASCRSHFGPSSWAHCPVVLFATTRQSAEWLQTLVAHAGCGFNADPSRPEFMVIEGPSIKNFMTLAYTIIEKFATAPVIGLECIQGDYNPDQGALW